MVQRGGNLQAGANYEIVVYSKAFDFTRMGDMFVREIQLELSCSVLHLDNRSVRMLQILESFLDLVKPIYSSQLEGHRIFLALCAMLHTSDRKL